MCVIIHCEKIKPDLDTLEKCEKHNSDGGGIAWRANDVNCYIKGINAKEIFSITQNIKLPFVIHFRIGTVGDKVAELCHPFEIKKNSPLHKENITENNLLFHNGHISEHQILTKMFSIKLHGHVSDTRNMAAVLSKTSIKKLRHFTERNRFVIFGKKIIKMGNWAKEDDIYYSNLNWKSFNHFKQHPEFGHYFHSRAEIGKSSNYVYHNGQVVSREEYKDMISAI